VWLAVNLSVRQVAEPGLAATLRDVLRATAFEPDFLRLELTEAALLRAGHSASEELRAVQDLGVHIGMDDFGSGYASLSNLQRLPISFLKIDRPFVEGLRRNPDESNKNNALVEAITSLGTILNLEVIAEGIETDEQRDVLRGYGCRFGQGFLLARPAPAADLSGFLSPAK
jgi:EAL domain-containing protein (putative c-di-GMP-specific phosphodiesterase class I)